MQLQRVEELKPEPLAWLWQGRLALGKVAMLDGDPGLGKRAVPAGHSAGRSLRRNRSFHHRATEGTERKEEEKES